MAAQDDLKAAQTKLASAVANVLAFLKNSGTNVPAAEVEAAAADISAQADSLNAAVTPVTPPAA